MINFNDPKIHNIFKEVFERTMNEIISSEMKKIKNKERIQIRDYQSNKC
jgi:hypothetical protein